QTRQNSLNHPERMGDRVMTYGDWYKPFALLVNVLYMNLELRLLPTYLGLWTEQWRYNEHGSCYR
ncbi:MAG: hypothetical protein QGF20_06195, partial [Alphaproteobacteria bacterium]|nr:hypothetical protein [Alphaproteobacteria bacterium]